MEKQKARKLKREEKPAKEEKRKKEKAERAKMNKTGPKKKRGRVKVLGDVVDRGNKRVKCSSELQYIPAVDGDSEDQKEGVNSNENLLRVRNKYIKKIVFR